MSEGGFRYTRHVKFYETDLAGVVHFSNYFRYMEEAEHALWRAAGLTVDRAGADVGYPRVSATFDYRSPLFFEDELTIVVRVHAVTQRTIKFSFAFSRHGAAIGTGWLTTACATRQEDGSMRATELPADVVPRLCAAAGQAGTLNRDTQS
ncbi:MAG TPA: thioesterase family protein [Vicinamibacterales bacterium]|nr:thioesterase family protein [Vicinamibacterales bacterium]